MLTDTSEQLEDVFRIFVYNKMVIALDLIRRDPKALLIETRQYLLKEYVDAVGSGLFGVKLRFALELARQDLGQPIKGG